MRVLAVIPESTSGHGFIFAKRQVAQLEALGCDVRVFHLRSRTGIFSLARDARQFRKMSDAFRPDVVHAHYGSVVGFFSVLLSRVPVVITFRGSDLNPNPDDTLVRGFLARFLSQAAAMLASRAVCVSANLERRLWFRGRAVVIPTGVDLEEFYPVDRDAARAILDWPLEQRIVLFNTSQAVNPNKRLDLAKAATELAAEKLGNVRLVVLNGGVPGNMVNLYMNASDALLLCSEHEGSPTVVQEALACNVPVCSVDVGDVAAMIDSVANCTLVERNAESIADALIRILQNPTRSDGRRYSARYSSRSGADKLISMFGALR